VTEYWPRGNLEDHLIATLGARKRTIFMWLVWICIGFISWPLTTWLPTMFKTVYQLPLDTALTYGLITTSGAIVTGTLICSLLIDMVGRRRWFLMAFSIAALAMLSVWLAGAQPVLLVVALAAVTMFFIASLNLSIYVYTPENYPTRLRTLGMGVCTAWSRIAGMIAPHRDRLGGSRPKAWPECSCCSGLSASSAR
jgi:putative MFS transporter